MKMKTQLMQFKKTKTFSGSRLYTTVSNCIIHKLCSAILRTCKLHENEAILSDSFIYHCDVVGNLWNLCLVAYQKPKQSYNTVTVVHLYFYKINAHRTLAWFDYWTQNLWANILVGVESTMFGLS